MLAKLHCKTCMLRSVLLLVCALGLASCAIPWELYHKTSQLVQSFQTAAKSFPAVVRYQDIPDPNSDLSLPVLTVTDHSSGESGKEVILVVAGEHARELITSEVVYWLVQVLSAQDSEFAAWPAAAQMAGDRKAIGLGGATLHEWVASLLKTCVFKIIPVANMEGREAVEQGNLCLRATPSGVDLNRNWPVAWQQQALTTEEYGGKEPLSEPQARIIKFVAETNPLRAYVNLHSGEFALYAPWDSKEELADNLPVDTESLLEQLNIWCKCMHGAAGKVAGYLAYGTGMDYMYDQLHVPYPLTFEVWGPGELGKLAAGGRPRRLQQAKATQEGGPEGAMAAVAAAASGTGAIQATQSTTDPSAASEPQECFDAYNPGTPADYQETIVTWVATLLTLADHVVSHPTASHASQDAEQQQQPLPAKPLHKMDLAKHIGTDEEAMLLHTAKKELNIKPELHGGDRGNTRAEPDAVHSSGLQTVAITTTMGPRQKMNAATLATDSKTSSPSALLGKVLIATTCAALLLYTAWRKVGSPTLFVRRRRTTRLRHPV